MSSALSPEFSCECGPSVIFFIYCIQDHWLWIGKQADFIWGAQRFVVKL